MHSSIKVSNLQHGEVLTYPLVMVKGQVTGHKEVKVSGLISVKTKGTDQDWPVVGGAFKILLRLHQGKNKIELRFESVSLQINLCFEPPDRKFVVTPLYIVSKDHDGHFQGAAGADCSLGAALARIQLGAQLLQSVLAEKLWEEGVGRRTFGLERDPQVHRSDLSAEAALEMAPEELWAHFGRELVTKWGPEEAQRRKFVAFLACTRYQGGPHPSGLLHEQILALTKGHAALGGGGLALFGTACLHTWPTTLENVLPCFADTTPVDQTILMDDSGYRGTYGGCYSTTLGAVLHELCHTFDLGHTKKGIMGRGFDRMDLIFRPEAAADVPSTPPAHQVVDFTVNLKVECVTSAEPKVEVKPQLKKSRSGGANSLLLMDCTDHIYFTQSCAAILAFHRWINDEKLVKTGSISFDNESWTIKSSVGLRVVEVREGETQLVCNWWCFSPSRLLFVLPRSSIAEKSKSAPLLLFAQDVGGNIFKTNLPL
ncbi:uncharacterized protein LOC132204114 [Neocloeon triangulifer]|uniref:uncharacterized protein LOC132204114 n=1 Tax=Neocloeon triangulifer TaxID=2078957 RepID=UPI00286F8872|nr:uncharacterized protein LOC132204114 [Neocloeon triangulifer]XP_059488372.1 uncharacterized protein LOC132204114 [Neocloeon triangulifer]XP_059488374.1 uncharacterized protein LOC132204114 [Neocloeon triangulifer]XP_059488375.1 uncharacterized protein LOC132204114 [Neocloeon triangulifer]